MLGAFVAIMVIGKYSQDVQIGQLGKFDRGAAGDILRDFAYYRKEEREH
jgi:hypothetical protein